jgi:O-Antigen ligase/Tetratricopeptide repeat
LIAPLALIVALAIVGGGFDLSDRHIAGLAAWLVVVGLLALGAAGRASLGRPFYLASGLILGLALLSAISSLWSGSIELSVTEADRVLVYLGLFLVAFLIAQTDQRRQRFAEGIAIGLALIAFAALANRLLPHALDLGPELGSGPRLRYPLGYWNADGLVFGTGIPLLLWLSRRSLTPILRWFAVASLPVLMLALYLTYSRGGLLALLVAGGCLLALSYDRLWLLATLAIGALGTLPALIAVQDRRGIADFVEETGTVDQGVTVLLLLLAGIGLTLALYAGLRRLEGRDGGLTGKAVELSRNPTVLKRLAVAAALLAIAAAVAVGGQVWSQFTDDDVQFPNRPEQHITSLSGANRDEFWGVAIDAFGEKPVLGGGAGTYQFSWNQLRSISVPVSQAHSLYLEAFAELGLVGGLLVLALVGSLLWTGFSAWRAAQGAQRELFAVMLAAALAFAVGAAIDWFWETAVLGAIFFLAGGVLVAGRCAQLAPGGAPATNGRRKGQGFGLTVAGLVIAWVTALALIGPLLVDREIKASHAAAAEGNLAGAENHADTARSIEPWAASPYVQLGLLAQVQGDYPTAAERLSQAIKREDRNWILYYLRAKIAHEAGDTAGARADLRRARQLNPREPCLQEGWNGCG